VRYQQIKNILDFLIALLFLITTLPILFILMLLMILADRASPLLKQVRVGKGRKEFKLYKLRTMQRSYPLYAVKPGRDDKKITPLGRFLRNSGLDELPQLFNVLKGEMSFIGPRPEMPFLIKEYSEEELRRLLVKPGITGLWQISGKTDRPIRENIALDIYYVENISFKLDAAIFIKSLKFFLCNCASSATECLRG